MQSNNDFYGYAPDKSEIALLLIDVINDLEFEGGQELLQHALPAARNIAVLKEAARRSNTPVIYVNDNFGRWRSDFTRIVDHCLHDGVRGQAIAELLAPVDDDYFVLKPKHSAFYGTTLDLLLQYLGARKLVITGIAGNNCVLFTANDAYMRDYQLMVPSDCIASIKSPDNESALRQMELVLKADTRPSSEISFARETGTAHEQSRR